MKAPTKATGANRSPAKMTICGPRTAETIPPAQDPRYRLRLVERRRGVGGGEAQFLGKTVGGAENGKTEGKEPETFPEERDCGDRGADRRNPGTDHEGETPADKARERCDENDAQRHADIVGSQRRRRQRLVVSEQLIAGNAADGKADRADDTKDRLRRRQKENIAARFTKGRAHIIDGSRNHGRATSWARREPAGQSGQERH